MKALLGLAGAVLAALGVCVVAGLFRWLRDPLFCVRCGGASDGGEDGLCPSCRARQGGVP